MLTCTMPCCYFCRNFKEKIKNRLAHRAVYFVTEQVFIESANLRYRKQCRRMITRVKRFKVLMNVLKKETKKHRSKEKAACIVVIEKKLELTWTKFCKRTIFPKYVTLSK